MSTASVIYKITPRKAWEQAEKDGRFDGAPVDKSDGYIHFSTADQLRETAAKHFAGQHDLLLIAVEGQALGTALKWEKSRGGALFPHLYGVLHMTSVIWAHPMPLGDDGTHILPQAMR